MKPVIEQLANCVEFGYKFDVDDKFWAEIEEIVYCLQPGFDLTKKMQEVGYGLSDFYIGWLCVKRSLSRIVKDKPRFNLAANLIDRMDLRTPSLFQSPLLLCSVYLDPRIMFTLPDEQKAAAAMDLLQIYDRISKTSCSTNKDANNTLDELMQEFKAQLTENDGNKLLQEISIYESEQPYDYKKPIMHFWDQNSQKYQLLRPLADVLHAVPSNQCCTERAFSSLSYIRSKLRMSMSAQNVSNVLMVRLNKDIYYDLRKERIQNILE